MLSDGYIWVKVDDQPKVPKSVNWKQKHVLLWEEENGPVPENHVVLFLDNDRTNITIENLALVSRAQLAVLNKNGLIQDYADATKAGILTADLIMSITKAKKRK